MMTRKTREKKRPRRPEDDFAENNRELMELRRERGLLRTSTGRLPPLPRYLDREQGRKITKG